MAALGWKTQQLLRSCLMSLIMRTAQSQKKDRLLLFQQGHYTLKMEASDRKPSSGSMR